MMQLDMFYRALELWFDRNRRVLPWRETQDPYKIWISEIILQQTRVEQGLDYYLRFVDRFPDVRSLAAASEDEVLRLWQGLGYYSRARNLHKAAVLVADHFPDSYDELRRMPGVGDYTAGAIAAFAYNLPYPALDGNVYRVLARLTDSDIAFDTTQGKKFFRHIAEQWLDTSNPRLFNSAIMEFGALYCVPQNPDCVHCPLQVFCEAYRHHTVALLPVRKPRPKMKDRYLVYTIYLYKSGSTLYTLIRQRLDNDIWKHLWEFPLSETDAAGFAAVETPLDFTHQLSHRRLHARFVVKKVSALPSLPDTKAVTLDDLDDYALSRLTLNALSRLAL